MHEIAAACRIRASGDAISEALNEAINDALNNHEKHFATIKRAWILYVKIQGEKYLLFALFSIVYFPTGVYFFLTKSQHNTMISMR